VARTSPLLPDLEDVCNTYTTLVTTWLGAFEPSGKTTLTADIPHFGTGNCANFQAQLSDS
jgi:hypothetical protein